MGDIAVSTEIEVQVMRFVVSRHGLEPFDAEAREFLENLIDGEPIEMEPLHERNMHEFRRIMATIRNPKFPAAWRRAGHAGRRSQLDVAPSHEGPRTACLLDRGEGGDQNEAT